MTSRILPAACAVLAATLLHVAPAAAQQGAPTTQPPLERRAAPPMGPRRGPPTVDERIQRMTTELNLTPDQAAKMRGVFAAEQKTMDSILARRTAERDAEHAAMEAMRSTMQKSVASILTPEQRVKHDAMRARMEGGRGGMGPGMRGPGMRGRDMRGPDDRGRGDRRDDRRGPPPDDRGGRPDAPPRDGDGNR